MLFSFEKTGQIYVSSWRAAAVNLEAAINSSELRAKFWKISAFVIEVLWDGRCQLPERVYHRPALLTLHLCTRVINTIMQWCSEMFRHNVSWQDGAANVRGISQSSSLPLWSPIPPAARRRPEPASRSLPLPFDLQSPGIVERREQLLTEHNQQIQDEIHWFFYMLSKFTISLDV